MENSKALKLFKKVLMPLGLLFFILLFFIPAKNKLADFYFQEGNNNLKNKFYKSAVINYEKSLALKSKNYQLKNNLADVYLSKNQTEKAIHYYRESVKDNRKNSYGWLKLIETQLANNQIDKLGTNILGLNFGQLDNNNPEQTKLAYARFLIAISEIERSVSILSEVKNDKSIFYQLLIDLSKYNYVSAKSKLAEINSSGEFNENIKKTGSYLEKINNTSSEVYQKTVTGQLFNEVGEPYLAIKLLKEVVEKNPQYRDANLFLGYSYLLTNNFDSSEEYLLKAEKEDNIYGLTYYLLGKLYQANNKPELAKDNYEKAVNFGYQSSSIHESLADIYQNNFQLNEAEKYYLLALEDKQNFSLLSRLAENMILNNKIKEAMELFQEYRYPAILGRIYLADRNEKKASQYLQEAENNDTYNPYVSFYLAELYLTKNQRGEAKKYYQKTAELDFGGQFAKKSEEKLANL